MPREIWNYRPLLEHNNGGPKTGGTGRGGGENDPAREQSEFPEAEAFIRSEAFRLVTARAVQRYREDLEVQTGVGTRATGKKANIDTTLEALRTIEKLMIGGLEEHVVREYKRIGGGKLAIDVVREEDYDPDEPYSLKLRLGQTVKELDITIQRGSPPPPDPFMKYDKGRATRSSSSVLDVAEPFYRVSVYMTDVLKENQFTPPEFDTADGIVMQVGQRGTCRANGLKYVGSRSFTDDKPMEIDKEQDMGEHITGLFKAIQQLPLMPK